jgi:predicted transcriptional regulator YheO
MIRAGAWKTRDGIGGHTGRTPDGRVIRSSTLFIKDDSGLLGMLTLNQDLTPYISLSQDALDLGNVDMNKIGKSDKPGPGLQEGLNERIQEAFMETGIHKVQGQGFSQAERILLVEKLIGKDVFLVRGSVSKVARRLGCSVASLYRYIAAVNERRGAKPKDSDKIREEIF